MSNGFKSNTESDDDIDDYFIIIKRYMTWNGTTPSTDSTSSLLRKIGNVSYRFTMSVIMHQMALSYFFEMLWPRSSDKIEFVGIVLNAVTYFIAAFQMGYFRKNYKHMLHVINTVNKSFRYSSLKGYSEINIKPYYKYMKIGVTIWAWITIIGTQNFTLISLVSKSRKLPLSIWYPFNPLQSPIYEIVFVTQVIAQFVMCQCFANTTNFYSSFMILASGQFRILNFSLRNLYYTAMVRTGVDISRVRIFAGGFNKYGNDRTFINSRSRTSNTDRKGNVSLVVDDQSQKEFSREQEDSFKGIFNEHLHDAIRECAIHHQQILLACDIVADFLSPIIFIKVLFLTSFLCISLLIASATSNTEKIVNFLEYMSISLLELLIFSYFGTKLTEESILIREAVYECPWYMCNSSFKRSMYLIVMRTQRPVVFSASKFYDLNLATFTQVVKASFSYYTCMKSINDNT